VKRWLAIAAVVLGLGAVLYAVFAAPSDEEEIRAQLDRLALVVGVTADEKNPVIRGARLKREFAEIFTEDVAVSIPELTSLRSGRDELAAVGARAGTYFQTADVSISQIDIEIDGAKTRAQVRSVATLTGSRGGELERDERRVRFEFVQRDGDWLIDAVRVGSRPSDSEPDDPTTEP
jgi:hypothetical protein